VPFQDIAEEHEHIALYDNLAELVQRHETVRCYEPDVFLHNYDLSDWTGCRQMAEGLPFFDPP
jgi:hypothetical protein